MTTAQQLGSRLNGEVIGPGESGYDEARAVYGEVKYARLAALKTRYDPTNFFRFHQNVKPAGAVV